MVTGGAREGAWSELEGGEKVCDGRGCGMRRGTQSSVGVRSQAIPRIGRHDVQ